MNRNGTHYCPDCRVDGWSTEQMREAWDGLICWHCSVTRAAEAEHEREREALREFRGAAHDYLVSRVVTESQARAKQLESTTYSIVREAV